MKKTHQYYTRVMSFRYYDIYFYYIDEQNTTIQEFFDVYDKGFNTAVKEQYHLFQKFETYENNIDIRICLN